MRRLPQEVRDNIVSHLGTDNIEQGVIIAGDRSFEVRNLRIQREKERILNAFAEKWNDEIDDQFAIEDTLSANFLKIIWATFSNREYDTVFPKIMTRRGRVEETDNYFARARNIITFKEEVKNFSFASARRRRGAESHCRLHRCKC